MEFLGPNQEVIPLSYSMLKVAEANLFIVTFHCFIHFNLLMRVIFVVFFFF